MEERGAKEMLGRGGYGGRCGAAAASAGARGEAASSPTNDLLRAVARTPNVPDVLAVGTQLGRYQIQGILGVGGMSVVYSAVDTALGRTVAVKLLQRRCDGALLPEASRRLEKEARALARLSHPNVVAVFDVGMHDDETWIAMEHVDGCTLREWIERRPRSWRESLPLLIGVARGLAAAHARSLVHRDLKPDNVMIGDDGRARIMDFGLVDEYRAEHRDVDVISTPDSARRYEPTLLCAAITETGLVLGSPAYTAPERWRNLQADPRTDQFAWAVLAWETLFGERPFGGSTICALREEILGGVVAPPPSRDVPDWLASAVRRGLAVDPEDRWPSVGALADALERRLGDDEDPRRGRFRRRSALVVSALGLAAASLYASRSDRPILDPDGCYIRVEPELRAFTPPFNSGTDCSCGPDSPYCRRLYQGQVAAVQGHRADLEFKKITGDPPSKSVHYWVVRATEEPQCHRLDEHPYALDGFWSPRHDTLRVENVPIWGSEEEYRAAPAGATQRLFLVTGNGVGDVDKRTWFQPQVLVFTKECVAT